MDSSSTVIDEGVIDRAINGDKEAFSVIVRGTGARVLLVAERILRSPEDGISAVHSLFVIAFSSLKKLKSKGFLETWLLQILVGVCGERLKEKNDKSGTSRGSRKKGKSEKSGATVVSGNSDVETRRAAGVATAAVTSAESASRRLSEIRARSEHVRRAVDGLPFKERTAVMFRDWDGVSAIEVAEILRVSREDVRRLLVDARKTLANMLEASQGWCSYAQDIQSARTRAAGEKGALVKSKSHNKCGKHSERLWLLVGGELGQTEQVDLIAHLERCPECGECLARASVVLEAVREAAPVEDEPRLAPDTLWKEIEPLLAG